MIHVHALGQPQASDGVWTKRIRSLLDLAVQKADGMRPRDDKDGGIRAANTFRTLDEMQKRLSKVEGPKTVLWVTAGSPTWLRYPYGCKDVSFPQGSGSYLAAKCTSDFTKFLQGQTLDYTPFVQHFSAMLEENDTVLNTERRLAMASCLLPTPGRRMTR